MEEAETLCLGWLQYLGDRNCTVPEKDTLLPSDRVRNCITRVSPVPEAMGAEVLGMKNGLLKRADRRAEIVHSPP